MEGKTDKWHVVCPSLGSHLSDTDWVAATKTIYNICRNIVDCETCIEDIHSLRDYLNILLDAHSNKKVKTHDATVDWA